ncbi:DUF5683 domain-containing protein [Mesonia maritima]|uniref:DUF5683 domain-containing protein n=1 Tax=Mesonia maritima TaxID=1793873 RepID=A0ABU1K3T5_9FLAO|nr:DUF5683 domain-containing protein [Mesonia maritima]MDR6300278.1 hypothetical protein [Mesonia maritima]
MNKLLFFLSIFFFLSSFSYAQKDSLAMRTERISQVNPETTKNFEQYNPLAPAKAAFYSAVLPGLGQAYNGSYWKIPLVYGAIGGGIYAYVYNNKQYHKYRDAYKSRLAGETDDEFMNILSDDALVDAQKRFRRNKEISLLVTIAAYALNIIDANVEAHLRQFNVSEDLALRPNFGIDEFSGKANYNLSLNFNF